MILEKLPIVLLYGTYLRVALLVMFVIHTVSYMICDSMMSTISLIVYLVYIIHEFYTGKTCIDKMNYFVLLGCGTIL